MTVATVAGLRAAGVLSGLDEQFARTMGRIAGEEHPEVLLAAALASRHVGNGHVCLDLQQLVSGPALLDAAGEPVASTWPDLRKWIDGLQHSALVGGADDVTPLVLDAAGRLYLRRYWEHERRLAAALQARATSSAQDIDAAWLRGALDRLFPRAAGLPEGATDWQRMAAVVAVLRRLCVISGGPGTGKTFTVVKLLALLIEHADRCGRPRPRMTLLAPTGKAAARLSEAIQRTKATLACAADVRDAIPDEAATIHRCLSPVAGSATHFRYHADHPLFTDLVLIDEASMVDLALMARVVAALPAHARLILLGDQDQLASVEAGAVLGDICNTGRPRHYSAELVETIAALTGERLPLPPQAPRRTGIWDCIVQLVHSYRYEAASGIGAVARAINAGDAATALDVLEASGHPAVTLVEPASGGPFDEALQRAVVDGFSPALQAGEPAARLQLLERFRILCAHRRGPDGVETVNRLVEATLLEAGLVDLDRPAYRGRPVLVTRNDYQLKLFNGDVGVVEGEGATGRRVVAFPARGGGVRLLSPTRLPPHETVFAMSVHKSQGSEFDAVAVLLPARVSPVVSRELLYTAVTRARHAVTIYASRDAVVHAVSHPIERASGLRDLLWGAQTTAGR